MSEKSFKKISVVGLGYIGLPTAAMFASRKIEVVGVDVNQKAVDTINRGEIHIVEPDLDIIVQAAVKEGYLRATTKAEPAEAFLIAVPTPFKGDNHEPDLSYIKAASMAIAPVLEAGNLVILESTSPIGATETMAQWLSDARPDLSFPGVAGEKSDIRIAHCPERVLPGKVMQELIANDRIIGGMTEKCSMAAIDLYKSFVIGECVIASSTGVAEMAKLTENSFRDVNIAFANELSVICDKLKINVWELIALANRHPRVSILRPGPGVGGHCIAVDPWFIVSSAPNDSKLIRDARNINDNKPLWVIDKVHNLAKTIKIKQKKELVIGVYGLAFKPNIDDLRQSPSVEIAKELSKTYKVNAIEPNISELPEELSKCELVHYKKSIEKCDIALILVAHDEFDQIEFPQHKTIFATKK